LNIQKQNEVLGFIPARGGSKGVPQKNIHTLGGHPLIQWSIASAQQSTLVARSVVSTDSKKIADVASQAGAHVDIRPNSLSSDSAIVEDVIIEFLTRLGKTEAIPEYMALIQPTSPFVTPLTMDTCLKALISDPTADSVQSVTLVTHHNHAINQRIVEDGIISFAFPHLRGDAKRKQDKQQHYALGNFIAFRVENFLETGKVYGERSLVGDTVSCCEAIDIDSLDDFKLAEIYLKASAIPSAPQLN
jgi:CMP-N,N'-diacetyllegionaminic acid synthase